jgi:hypothetical protein
VGSKANYSFGPRHSWPCSYHGRDSCIAGILCYHALVEDAVAKLTYAPFIVPNLCTSQVVLLMLASVL